MTNQDTKLVMTQSITTFNDLSSELILCIFEYLSVADRYKSFFNYDTRLRQLVKRWTSYNRKELDADISRFSTLHSWYKMSLRNGGVQFFIYPRQDQQPRNYCSGDINAPNLHWWFIWYESSPSFTNERVRDIIHRHSFRLTPFFYHKVISGQSNSNSDDKKPSRTFYGGDIITWNRDRENLKQWLTSNYPEYADRILNANNSYNDINEACAPVFEAEWLKSTRIIRDAAYEVWKELGELEDVNPLEIREGPC
ncbi:unnamed protein product [Rotaria sp. Silwood1]|nr:unnamed protein product [Rotaria sp. Silwood1]CAF4912071.1 unnamed protein product [Rotaria sp. Silwood1]